MNLEFEKFLNNIEEVQISSEKIIRILNEIQETIKRDNKFFKQATNIDFKRWKKNVDFDKLSNIIDKYINLVLEEKNKLGIEKAEKVVVSYYGNPYLTLNLCLQAIIYKKYVLLETGEFMLSSNNFIVNMINQILKDNRLPSLLIHCIDIEQKEKIIENNIKTIIIGASNYKAKYLGKYIYVPYNNYIMYCQDESLEELRNSIYEYASNNFFEMEVLFEEDINEVIENINLEKDCIAIILTKDANLQNLFREKIKNKLYINANPFIQEEINIPTNCLK